MRDEFAWLKSNWLENIAADAELPASALRIAVMIAMHLNKQSGTARVGLELLAFETKMTKRGVQKLIEALAKRGHISVDRGGGGRNVSEYRPRLPEGYVPLLTRTAAERKLSDASGGEQPFTSDAGRGEPQFTSAQGREVNARSARGERAFTQTPYMNPHTRAHARDGAAEASKGCRWTWEQFERVWRLPIEGDREAAEKAFEGLAPAERVLAIGYIAADRERAEAKGREPRSALDYLFERDWRALVPAIRPGNIRVSQGGVPFEVWDSVWRVVKGKGLPTDKRGGWLVESELPRGFALPPLATADRTMAPVSERAAP